jgi:hypothetical protein
VTFNDTAQTTQSAEVYGSILAYGGNGGSSDTGSGANGGAATAGATITGAKSLDVYVSAYGGNAGTGAVAGAGSAASATGTAVGTTHVVSSVAATGGTGKGSSAKATAMATGMDGYAQSQSSATDAAYGTSGVLADSGSASVTTSLAGNGVLADSAKDLSLVQFGLATPTSDTTDQGVAYLTGAPTTANVNAVLAANSAIKAAFAVSPSYFGIAELGGAFTTGGTAADTTTSTVTESVDLSQLTSRQDLLVGLYGGTLVGAGVTGVMLTISANNSTLLTKSFASGAAALAYFTNDAVDLGSLNGTLFSNNVANITVSLAVTSLGAGSGFYGNILIGDPPAAAASTPVPAPVHDFMPAGASTDVIQPGKSTFADWAHLLGATTQRGIDLASSTLDHGDVIPLRTMALASLAHSHAA